MSAGLFILVADMLGHAECGGVLSTCLVVSTAASRASPRPFERYGFTEPVAGLPEQRQSLPVMVGGPLIMALPRLVDPQVGQRVGFAKPVARFAADSDGLLKVIGGLLIVTQPPVDSAEAGQRPGFARPASASRYRYDQETPPALRCKRLPRHSASPAAAAG